MKETLRQHFNEIVIVLGILTAAAILETTDRIHQCVQQTLNE